MQDMKKDSRSAATLAHDLSAARNSVPLQRADGSWVTHCPEHDDNSPSLTVMDTENGPIANCAAGCGKVDMSGVRIMQDA